MAATRHQTLQKAASTQKNLTTLERKATVAALDRDRALLAAYEAGHSYAELEDATGLSTARVTQVLRKAREARAQDA